MREREAERLLAQRLARLVRVRLRLRMSASARARTRAPSPNPNPSPNLSPNPSFNAHPSPNPNPKPARPAVPPPGRRRRGGAEIALRLRRGAGAGAGRGERELRRRGGALGEGALGGGVGVRVVLDVRQQGACLLDEAWHREVAGCSVARTAVAAWSARGCRVSHTAGGGGLQPRLLRRFEAGAPRPTARCTGVTREPW